MYQNPPNNRCIQEGGMSKNVFEMHVQRTKITTSQEDKTSKNIFEMHLQNG